jgi:hypothetical protein
MQWSCRIGSRVVMDYGISTVMIQVTSYPDDVMLHVYIPCLHSNNLNTLCLQPTYSYLHICCLPFPFHLE